LKYEYAEKIRDSNLAYNLNNYCLNTSSCSHVSTFIPEIHKRCFVSVVGDAPVDDDVPPVSS
jgi:hypothetical protein